MGCGKNVEVEGVQRHDGCVCEALRFIKRLQDIQTDDDCLECNTDCFMRPLGSLNCPTQSPINTRVFSLLTKTGDQFKSSFQPISTGTNPTVSNCYSVFFRVQNIFNDCCATLQVLAPFKDAEFRHPVKVITDCGKLNLNALCEAKYFKATNTCITVDLSCFCGVQCLDDIYVDFCKIN